MFRTCRVTFIEAWACVVVLLVFIADYQGLFYGTWLDGAMAGARVVLYTWLILSAIDLLRRESNP